MSGAIIAAVLIMIIALLAGVPAVFAFFTAALIITLAGGYNISELASFGYLEITSTVLLAVPLIIFTGIIMHRCGVRENRLKIFIPSGIALLLYAFTGGQSIAACLLASVVPAVVLALLHMMVSRLIAKRAEKLQEADEAEEIVEADEEEDNDEVEEEKVDEEDDDDDEEDDDEQRSLIPAIIAPTLIFIGACSGIVTIAEAAVVAAIYIFIMGWFFYRELDGDDLKDSLVETGMKAGSIMLTVFVAMILAWLFIMEGVPYNLSEGLLAISDNNAVSVIFVIIMLMIAGLLMDRISATLLMTPVIVQAILFIGINPVQFAVVMALSIGIGRRLMSHHTKEDLMYIGLAWLPTLLLTTYIPRFSLLLPILLGYV